MKRLACSAASRRLQAFYDGELPIGDRIAVDAHLEQCEACTSALAELQVLRSVVRSTRRERLMFSDEDDRSFRRSVVSRLKAEQSLSLSSRIPDMFEDMRLVYAGLGATVAAVTCVLMMLNVMRSVTEDRQPNSLAAIVKHMASAEANQRLLMPNASSRPVVEAATLLLPRSSGATFAADSDADVILHGVDAEFALTGVVTSEGRVANLELVHASNGQPVAPGTDEARALQKLMGAVARNRYAPARVDGLPVAVNKVWLVAHTTVHGSKNPHDRPVSIAAKKRVTIVTDTIDGRAPRPA